MAKTSVKYAEYYQIYVWELPVRFYHWINALCIVVLAVTGYLIGAPIAINSSAEASFQYWFGTVRFLHFLFAFIFFFNFLFRIYWGFVGNTFAGWKNFIPYTARHWKEIFHVLCLDVLQICKQPLKSIGHNSLAGLTYFLTFLVFLFQALTGFGLYAAMSKSWFPKLFAWIVPLMGGDFAVRQWHHMMMWFFVIFSMIHVYLVFYHDYIEERGTTSSMVGGWKFIEKPEKK
jgi:Ni/Fe-hydrogenase 1 B-type cytochrome subunit